MKLHKRLIIATFTVLRPFFGSMGTCCIYPVSCSLYAQELIEHKPLYVALPAIIIRVLCCNPITALISRFLNNKKKQ